MSKKKNTYHTDGHRTSLLIVLCLFGLCLIYAAAPKKKNSKDNRVYLVHSDELFYDMFGPNPEAQIVRGNVKFTHQGAILTCDSAYFYQEQNSVNAFGNVHYVSGDTLSLVCERAYYDGVVQLMEARKNVVLKHRTQTLYTDSLDYDRLWGDAYFYDGGTMIDGGDKLVSDWGNYNTDTKLASFYYNVRMDNDRQHITTDTLYYDTDKSLAHVQGKSHITTENTVIDTYDGYYNSDNDSTALYKRSVVQNGFKTITGDSVFYNKQSGQARGFGNAIYVDTENKNELHGDHLEYNELTGYGFATINALVKDYSQGDTLYAHSDSIKLYTYNIETDSVYRLVHCFDKVRAFRVDVQAICDSLVVDSRDSCMTMYHDPIAWNAGRQVLGEVIRVYSNDSTLREANVIGQALSIEMCDEENHYNQIAGDTLKAFFIDGKVRMVEAIKNVEMIYYPVDDQDSTLMFLNYTKTDTMRTYLTPERQLEKIWTCRHVSDMYPLTQIPPEKYKLPQFAWFDELRPRNKDDIFEWRGKSADAMLVEEGRQEPPKQRFADDTKSEAVEEINDLTVGEGTEETGESISEETTDE